MVWNSAGSTLYQAVEKHNSGIPPQKAESQAPPAPETCEPPDEHIRPTRHTSPQQELFRDKDMLLIAALILLLMHENADSKLILALAFVLLG